MERFITVTRSKSIRNELPNETIESKNDYNRDPSISIIEANSDAGGADKYSDVDGDLYNYTETSSNTNPWLENMSYVDAINKLLLLSY